MNPTETKKTSYLDELPRGVALYELFVDVVKTQSKCTTHVLGATSSDDRKAWFQKLSAVVGTNPPEVSI